MSTKDSKSNKTTAAKAPKAPKETKAKAPKAKSAADLKKEEERSKNLKIELAERLEARNYIPKKGTGKYFHANIELVQFNKAGKKISITNISLQSFETFLQWLKQASRLGFSFGMAHDAGAFYAGAMDQIKNSIKEYVKTANLENIQYGVEKLCTADGGQINNWLKEFYSKRVKHEEAKAKAARESIDYLD